MPVTGDADVLCVTEYSRVVPLENGEVVVSLINGRPGAKNFTFSHTLREFTKATNIRLRFLRTNTLLGHLISKAQRDPTVTRRYYYSIKDISVGGQCVCNGHAEVCNADNPEKLFRCECQHHTCGETCDRCCPGYNQRRWWPATSEQSNECEACNCHGHAIDCYYDADVERQQASLNSQGIYAGGGVCINCQHNTAGVNCESCAKGYYRPHGVPVDAPHGCIPCSCNPEQADGCEQGSGRCYCKPNFHGDNCEECAVGYYSFPFCLRIPIFPVSTPSPEDPVAGDIKGK
nr:laminin subunit alpha-3-like [Loxodonta africana]